jgi:hypothetical protein
MSGIAVRPSRDSDKPFIYDFWLDSFRLAHAAGPIPMRMYRHVYMQALDDLLARPGVEVLVACSPTDDDQVFGFLCFERRTIPVVHYAYVKQVFRRERVATVLMTAAGIPTGRPFVYTYKSPMAAKIAEHWTGAMFDPLVARFPSKIK